MNYAKFRAIASDEQRREKTLERVRKHRLAKELQPVTPCNARNARNAMQREKQREEGDEEYTNTHNKIREVQGMRYGERENV